MKKLASFLVTATCLFSPASFSTRVEAQTVPSLINYQGKLVSSNGLPVSTGDYELRFRIYDAAIGGNLVWGPQVFNGQNSPGFGPKVPVVQGWFNVMLGPVDTNGAAISGAFVTSNRFIEIQLGTNAAFNPRQQVLSAPYAIRSLYADTAGRVTNDRTTENLTLHVKTDGNDANDGLSESRAKRTIQAAVNGVPDRIEHAVDIAIWPGIYRESVAIRHKRVVNPSVAFLRLKGMGANPDAVRISGANADGVPVRQYGLAVEKSYVSVFNLSFEQTTGTGIYVSYGGELSAGRIILKDHPSSGLTVTQMSFASLEDVIIECAGTKGDIGIELSGNSSIGLRDDHRIPNGDSGIPALIGDPDNVVRNTIRNYRTGLGLYSWASVLGTESAMRFENVDLNIFKHGTGDSVSQP